MSHLEFRKGRKLDLNPLLSREYLVTLVGPLLVAGSVAEADGLRWGKDPRLSENRGRLKDVSSLKEEIYRRLNVELSDFLFCNSGTSSLSLSVCSLRSLSFCSRPGPNTLSCDKGRYTQLTLNVLKISKSRV